MSQLTVLQNIALMPVLELEPWNFATQARTMPDSSTREVPDAWYRYWLDCLTDSEITGLEPLRSGSWHVSVGQLADKPDVLEKLLYFFVNDWGGIKVFSDPDQKPIFGGGLALCSGSDVLTEPTCCADLSNLFEWQKAATYRETSWSMLWIGHPWLSIRYEAPWLVISDPHESNRPAEHWAVSPDDFGLAVNAAEAYLERFAQSLRSTLEAMGVEGIVECSQKLAGLHSQPVSIDSVWLTTPVRGLAELIRLERAFDVLPLLADALLDAGCGDEEILGHCRNGGPHRQACWVVEALVACS